MTDRTREERLKEREEQPGKPLNPDAADPTAEDPHDVLNNPADDPDPTEYPDPYDRRPDPREERETGTETSTSEPHPPRNYDELKPVKGDKED
jgi:hypothetical protein